MRRDASCRSVRISGWCCMRLSFESRNLRKKRLDSRETPQSMDGVPPLELDGVKFMGKSWGWWERVPAILGNLQLGADVGWFFNLSHVLPPKIKSLVEENWGVYIPYFQRQKKLTHLWPPSGRWISNCDSFGHAEDHVVDWWNRMIDLETKSIEPFQTKQTIW